MKFSEGLLLFTVILTVTYLLMVFKSRKKTESTAKIFPNFPSKSFLLLAYILAGLLTVLKVFWADSIIFPILIPVQTAFLLLLISMNSEYNNQIIGLTIYTHLLMLSLAFPTSGLFLTETSPAIISLDNLHFWNTDVQILNPYYNPFPMQMGWYYVVAQITGINYLTHLFSWLLNVFFVVAYDLTLFAVAKNLSGDWKIGCLSIFLLSFTPSLVINTQPQWLGNLFVLVFMLGLIKALNTGPSISSIILINIGYAVAVILHGTAAIALVFLGILMMLMFFGRKFGINTVTTLPQRSFVYVIFASLSLITLGRWIMFGGIESIINPLNGLFNEIFSPRESTWIGSQYVPLYDQFASPLSAFAWAVPISLVACFVIYQLFTRKQSKSLNSVFSSSMGIAAASLTFVGFLGSMFMAHGNLQRYIGYAGMSLFIPVAAIMCIKFLRSSSLKIIGVILVSLFLFTGVAAFDPAFSPQLYGEMKTVNPTRSADIIESQTLYAILPDGTSIISTYEILTGVWYLSLLPNPPANKINGFASSLKTHRLMVDQLVQGDIADGLTYIWTPEILEKVADIPINIVYSSGRHVALGR